MNISYNIIETSNNTDNGIENYKNNTSTIVDIDELME